jgi:hypothetical protein
MDHNRFKSILEKHILPMFTGSELSEQDEKPAWQKRRAFLRNVCELIVRAPGSDGRCFCFYRSQAYDPADAYFVETFVDQLNALESIANNPILNDVVNPLLRRTVAQRVSPEAMELVAEILAQFEAWSEQTYEGRKIAAAVGVDTGNATTVGVKLMDVFRKPFGAVVASGLETFLTASRMGVVINYQPLTGGTGSESLLAPLRFCSLAAWSTGNKLGAGLSRNGEILVFSKQGLIFAKRRGNWRHFTHNALIKRIALYGSYEPDICKAVYQSCLDVSFAKTGGGIAIIKRTKRKDLLAASIVNPEDLHGADNLKGQFLKSIIGKPFQELNRHLRQDILAMDGATILDYRGNVLAAGAIVKVDAGSDGGGRLLAAKTLAKYGLGIKISTDGEIRGFTADGTTTKEIFRCG